MTEPMCEVGTGSLVNEKTVPRLSASDGSSNGRCGRPATKRIKQGGYGNSTWCCPPHAETYQKHWETEVLEEFPSITEEDVEAAIASIKAVMK